MKCPRCEHENPAGMKFCGQCAASLMAACPACDAINPPGHKFCGQCAAPLQAAAAPAFPAPASYTPRHLAERILTSKAALEGERKQVTGLPPSIRVGLNSGEVVVRSIGSDLRMDYTAVGQTTHLAARMEQAALPGTIVITADTLKLAEGWVQVMPLGPVPPVRQPERPEVLRRVAGKARRN